MVDEVVTEEEKRQAKDEAAKAKERLEQRLKKPGAEVRYMAVPSSEIERLPSDWGFGL